jgi:hypothetical protein
LIVFVSKVQELLYYSERKPGEREETKRKEPEGITTAGTNGIMRSEGIVRRVRLQRVRLYDANA